MANDSAPQERAALSERLRQNAQVCRDEQKRVKAPLFKDELANNAREWDEAADALDERDREVADLRCRAYRVRVDNGNHDHSTGCLIWGDNGRGETVEGWTELPCTCGAWPNFLKDENARLKNEAHEREKALQRVIDLCDERQSTPEKRGAMIYPHEIRAAIKGEGTK